MKVGCSSAEALLQDMGHKCKTVRQLISYLEAVGHDAALELIKPEGGEKYKTFLYIWLIDLFTH